MKTCIICIKCIKIIKKYNKTHLKLKNLILKTAIQKLYKLYKIAYTNYTNYTLYKKICMWGVIFQRFTNIVILVKNSFLPLFYCYVERGLYKICQILQLKCGLTLYKGGNYVYKKEKFKRTGFILIGRILPNENAQKNTALAPATLDKMREDRHSPNTINISAPALPQKQRLNYFRCA